MAWLERQWQKRTVAAALLYPVSLLFGAAVATRRMLYARGLLRKTRLRVPVVVVGNITAGGTGKTPLVLWLAEWLRREGWRPGIVTRGYGGSAREPEPASAESDPARCGDEAVLLVVRSKCPVWVGRDRSAAGAALLAAHPECNVIVSDDGLQHYALERDVEIAVIDGSRGCGNGWLLPAGPLREPRARLRSVDAIVMHGGVGGPGPTLHAPVFEMHLVGRSFYNLLNAEQRVDPEYFQHRRVHALAGIGHPARFFGHLRHLGLTFTAHSYPDHHPFRASDLAFPDAQAILMTEKDAVKCLRLGTESCWVLPVDAQVGRALGELVQRKLGKP